MSCEIIGQIWMKVPDNFNYTRFVTIKTDEVNPITIILVDVLRCEDTGRLIHVPVKKENLQTFHPEGDY